MIIAADAIEPDIEVEFPKDLVVVEVLQVTQVVIEVKWHLVALKTKHAAL